MIKEITFVSLIHCVRFEALMVMNVKITVFWKIISHTLVCVTSQKTAILTYIWSSSYGIINKSVMKSSFYPQIIKYSHKCNANLSNKIGSSEGEMAELTHLSQIHVNVCWQKLVSWGNTSVLQLLTKTWLH